MIKRFALAMMVLLSVNVMHAQQPPPRANWMAMSECWKTVKGKSGVDRKIKIGLSTFHLDRTTCDTVGKAKATGMSTAGWFCFGDDKRPREITHLCQQVAQAEEDLGLKDVRRRAPVMNTYLVFTDLAGHLTQISFWDFPKSLASPVCESIRQDLAKSGVKDAECVLGNT